MSPQRVMSRSLQPPKTGTRRFSPLIAVCLVALLGASSTKQCARKCSAEPAHPAPHVDFLHDIQPIFQRACYRCHGPEKQKSEYRLDVRDVALKGGELYAPNITP